MNRRTLLGALALSLSCTGLGLESAAQAGPLHSQAGGYEVQVLVGGAPARTFYHDGETFALGQQGDRYTLRVVNHTGRRIEAVITVDGRDVVDGRTGDVHKRGYLVPAWGQVDVDGWRVSTGRAAAFRFSSVSGSYAARTGSARDVGVIGVAVFPERVYAPPPPVYRPLPRRYEPYGGYGRGDLKDDERMAEAPSAAQSAPAPPADKAAGPGRAYPYPSEEPQRAKKRPGLGTAFGEAVDSPVQEVSFTRADANHPAVVLGLRYNDRDGLIAMGVDVDGEYPAYEDSHIRRTATPFPAQRQYAAPPPGWNGY